MIRRYNIGLNSRMLFIKAKKYLEKEMLAPAFYIGREEVSPTIKVPITEYVLPNHLNVRLIGNQLVDRRFLEIEGDGQDIAKVIKEMRKNGVRMRLIK